MSAILHGTWLPAHQGLFFWGETGVVTPRKGRLPKLPPHPFQCPADALHEALAHLPASTTVPSEQTCTLWLPSVEKSPLPSPELLATGALEAPADPPVLRPWQVTGLLLPVSAALDLLLDLATSPTIGADLRAWRMAALPTTSTAAGRPGPGRANWPATISSTSPSAWRHPMPAWWRGQGGRLRAKAKTRSKSKDTGGILPLTREQATLYEATVRDALRDVEEAESEGEMMRRRGLVLAMLTRLKQICNRPAHFLQDGSALVEA